MSNSAKAGGVDTGALALDIAYTHTPAAWARYLGRSRSTFLPTRLLGRTPSWDARPVPRPGHGSPLPSHRRHFNPKARGRRAPATPGPSPHTTKEGHIPRVRAARVPPAGSREDERGAGWPKAASHVCGSSDFGPPECTGELLTWPRHFRQERSGYSQRQRLRLHGGCAIEMVRSAAAHACSCLSQARMRRPGQ
jgi:hypothetical protein